jgi:hypothetical protein
MGEQGAAVVVVAEQCANNADFQSLLPACGDTKRVQICCVWLFLVQTVSIPACWVFLFTILIYYESRTNVADGAGTATEMVHTDNKELIQRWKEISCGISAMRQRDFHHIGQLTIQLTCCLVTMCHMGGFTSFQR